MLFIINIDYIIKHIKTILKKDLLTMINTISNIQKTVLLAILVFLFSLTSCSNNKPDEKTDHLKQLPNVVITIESEDQFKAIVDSSGDRLLVFDLYADWCRPCKILSPILEEIAKENSDKASFYKINIEKHRRIAGMFRVSGIPFVLFVKNKNGVHSLIGVQPKATYQKAIDQFAQNNSSKES